MPGSRDPCEQPRLALEGRHPLGVVGPPRLDHLDRDGPIEPAIAALGRRARTTPRRSRRGARSGGQGLRPRDQERAALRSAPRSCAPPRYKVARGRTRGRGCNRPSRRLSSGMASTSRPGSRRPGAEGWRVASRPSKQLGRVLVAKLAARQFGRISRAQLRGLGVSDTTIHDWTRAGYLHPRLRGVHAVGHPARTLASELFEAVLDAGPGAMLSHRTAAWWLGLIDRPSPLIHVSTPRRRTMPRGSSSITVASSRAPSTTESRQRRRNRRCSTWPQAAPTSRCSSAWPSPSSTSGAAMTPTRCCGCAIRACRAALACDRRSRASTRASR